MATQSITLTAGHTYILSCSSAYSANSTGIGAVSLSGTALSVTNYSGFDLIDLGIGTGTEAPRVIVDTPDGVWDAKEYNITYTRVALYNLANGKQDALSEDSTPTSGHGTGYYVTSNGIYTALAGKANFYTSTPASPVAGDLLYSGGVLQYYNGSSWNTVSTTSFTIDTASLYTTDDTHVPSSKLMSTLLGNKQDTLTWDATPTSGSTNPVTSGGVYTALQNVGLTITTYSA